MDEICIIPTFQREELLWLCLEQIWKQGMNKNSLVCSDRNHRSQDLYTTVDHWETPLQIRQAHNFFGNSFNVITSMVSVMALMPQLKIVHLVEEDTLVHPGYFEWARIMLKSGSYACVLGRFADAPNWYESPCVSWDVDYLKEALTHITPEYFGLSREHMVKHVDEKIFPNSKYRHGGAEQDGFFLRCIEAHGWKTATPPVALATHLGWWGYNKMSTPPVHPIPSGDLAARIEQCRKVLTNIELRKKIFGHRIAMREWTGCSNWS